MTKQIDRKDGLAGMVVFVVTIAIVAAVVTVLVLVANLTLS